MRYWDENPIGDEDDFLKDLYSDIKIETIPEPTLESEDESGKTYYENLGKELEQKK